MSYTYKKRNRAELRDIADYILGKFPDRRNGFLVDIEGIVEDLGLEIIFRPGFGIPVEAYVARDPKYIVMKEAAFSWPPRARFTLAEEVAHRVLEFELWCGVEIPEGARVHEMGAKQHNEIESNARGLAAEILQPEAMYRERFSFHNARLVAAGGAVNVLKETVRAITEDFDVSLMSAAFRAKVLGIISDATYREVFPPLM